jgi:RNA recognition motif-containing protein
MSGTQAKDSQPAAAPAPAAEATKEKVEPSKDQATGDKKAEEKPALTPAELAKQKEEKDKKDAEWARKEAAFQAEREAREYQKTNTKLFLANLPRNYRKGEVENLCQRYGKITNTMVNSEKRFAFVTFATRDDAQYAIYDLQDKMVGGLNLRVSWSKPSEKEVQKKAEEQKARAKEEAEKNKAETEAKKAAADGKEGTEKPAPPPEVEKPRFSAQQKAVPKAAPKQQPKHQPQVHQPPVHQPVAAPVHQPVAAAPPQQHVAPQHVPQHQPAHAAPQQKQAQQPPRQQKANKQAAPPKPQPQRFKVTVQNETSGGDTVSLTISLEDWQKYIVPLFENYRLQLNRQ